MAEATSQISMLGTSSVRSVPISADWWLTHLLVIAKCNVFNGNNLIIWERTIEAALKPRRLLHHLTDDGPSEDHPTFPQWLLAEEIVFAWLLESIAPEQMSRFVSYETSKKLWEAIRRSHSNRGDKAKIIDLIIKSYTLKQGDRSILAFSNKLTIHTKLDHCHPKSTDPVATAREATNRLCQLLQGLRPGVNSSTEKKNLSSTKLSLSSCRTKAGFSL